MKKLLTLLLLFSLVCPAEGAFRKAKAWEGKPPVGSVIDWNNPLSKGLVGCWLMNEGGGFPRSLINGRPLNQAAVTWSAKNKGLVIQNASGLKSDTAGLEFLSGSWSIIVYFYNPQTFTSNYPSIFARTTYSNESTNSGWGIEGNNTKLTFLSRNDNGSYGLNSLTTPQANTNYIVVGTSDGTTRKIYLNGKFEAQTTNNPNPKDSVTNGISIGKTAVMQVPTYMALAYNRCLSPSEIQSLYVSPYQFIVAPKRNIMSTIGAVISSVLYGGEAFIVGD
jgi:hypothetical protein